MRSDPTNDRDRRPVVLLTGFGPFPGIAENASTRLAEESAEVAQRLFPAYSFHAAELPTEWHDGPQRARQLYRDHAPVAAIHFGVSARTRVFEIETRARNLRSLTADAAGIVPSEPALAADGPDILASRLPVSRILERLRRHGIPAALSRDAGGYLCNAVLYHAADFGRRHDQRLRAGFIHIPASLAQSRAQARRPAAPSRLDWDDALFGSLLIVSATLGLAPDLRWPL